MSPRFLLIPFILQGLVMAADELWYHRRREVPRLERLGHPVDTMGMLACLLWLFQGPPTNQSVLVYTGLAILSTLLITKDEFMHARHCRPGEHWLHAVLFILHPVVLLCAGLLWPALYPTSGANGFANILYSGAETMFLRGQTCLIFLFGIYQLIFWNLIWRHPRNPPPFR
ncbi:MAG: hypothetical protein ACKV2V_00315 [Blastocatellia bacterium]